MTTTIEAIYRKWVFVPQTSTEWFQDGQPVTITMTNLINVTKKWSKLNKLAKIGKEMSSIDYKQDYTDYLITKYH
jgi:predicted alpha/beta superfamily hydrolase